jgi:hypothetical protein
MPETRDETNDVGVYAHTQENTIPVAISDNKIKKGPHNIKTIEDLYEALDAARKQYDNGQVISHEVMMEKLKRYANES